MHCVGFYLHPVTECDLVNPSITPQDVRSLLNPSFTLVKPVSLHLSNQFPFRTIRSKCELRVLLIKRIIDISCMMALVVCSPGTMLASFAVADVKSFSLPFSVALICSLHLPITPSARVCASPEPRSKEKRKEPLLGCSDAFNRSISASLPDSYYNASFVTFCNHFAKLRYFFSNSRNAL